MSVFAPPVGGIALHRRVLDGVAERADIVQQGVGVGQQVIAEERAPTHHERIIVEARALNTKENASLSKDIITQRGFSSVLMVTSAFHMTRAFACFQAVGLSPDTLPVDFRMREPGEGSSWFPRTRTLNESAEALREWFGRLIYRVTG